MFSLPTLIHACHIVNNLPRISLPFPLPLFLVFIFMPGKKYKRNIWIEYSWRAILFIWLHPTFLSFSFVLVGKFRAITMFFLPFNFFPSSIVGFFVFWVFFLHSLPFILFFILLLLLFYFTILYWFCHTSTWICHGCTRVPHPEPPSHLPPHTIPLGHPSAPAPSFLYPASNLDWRFVSYMILYMF